MEEAPKKRTIFTVTPIIAMIAILACIVSACISPFVLLMYDDVLLKKELENSIINDNYSNWKSVNIGAFENIWVPNNWFVFSSSDEVRFEDDEGNVIAIGTLLGRPNSKYASQIDFLASILDSDNFDVSEDYIPGFVPINGSALGTMTVTDDNGSCTYYFLSLNLLLIGCSEELFLVFSNETPYTFDSLVEISQAIVFSLRYPVVPEQKISDGKEAFQP